MGLKERIRCSYGTSVVAHYEMVLPPVQDAGKRCIFLQLLQRDAYSYCSETDAFRRLADTQHRYPLTGNIGTFTERLQGILLSVMFSDHTEASGTAILGIQLEVVSEGFHYKVLWMDFKKQNQIIHILIQKVNIYIFQKRIFQFIITIFQ